MPSGPVSSITGCFLWFVADSGNVSNGTRITWWGDLSGSGNNLTFAGVSGASLPVYVVSDPVFNNHNVVSFSGTVNYLTTNQNNASLNFSPSSVTIFSVYSTPVTNTVQTLYSLDNSSDAFSSFAVSLNAIQPDTLNPSGWGWGWGKGGLNNTGWNSINASSTVYGWNIQQPNKLTIRYDRFRPDGKFAFGLAGVDIATGVANTQVSVNNFFNIGFDNSFNNFVQAKIAEIVAYNHRLTDVETSSVYNYLQVKYTPTAPTLYQADYNNSDYSWANYWDPDYWDLLPNFTAGAGSTVTQKSITASLIVDAVLTDQVIRKSAVSNGLVIDAVLTDQVVKQSRVSGGIVVDTVLSPSIVRDRVLSPSFTTDITLTTSPRANYSPSINLVTDVTVQVALPSASSTPFVLPSDLSALFAWYRSTSIGITGVDGSPVVFWPDDSGSGNHLTYAPFQSGSWTFPTFYRNQINGYPSVRWTNTPNYNYLSTNSNNASLNFASGDFTGFVVFRTSDTIDLQAIYSLDSIASQGNCGAFVVGLNKATAGFNYSYGNATELSTTATSPTFGTALYDSNVFMIRHDRFRQSDGELMFGRYGADVASGVSSTFASTHNQLNLGNSTWLPNPFIGDIAEVILYRRRLADNEVELVNTYLLLKYRPTNVGSIPLFLYSNVDSNTGIYNDRPLYINGANYSTSGSVPLYMGSANLSNSGQPLYTISIGNPSGTPTLYIAGNFQQFPPVTLYTHGLDTFSGNMVPLYIGSTRFLSSNTTLYVNGGLTNSSTGNIPLYIGTPGTTSGIPNNNIYLFTRGYAAPTSTGHTTLFLACDLSSSTPGLHAMYNTRPLFLEAGRTHDSMPLYLKAAAVDTQNSGWMPLFIGSPLYTGYFNTSIDLFLSNNVSGYSTPLKRLYIKGDGSLAGGSIATSPMFPLFLQQAGVTPVVSGKSNNISLYANSAQSGTNNLTMYISSATTAQSGKSLYTFNSLTQQSGVSLFTTGRDLAFTSNITLYSNGF